jgi:hypothetical protein
MAGTHGMDFLSCFSTHLSLIRQPGKKDADMNPALLVIDIKKDLFNISPECLRSLNNAIEYINMVMTYYRGKGLP